MGDVAFPTHTGDRIVTYKITSTDCWEVTSHSSGGAPGKDYPQAFINGKERHIHRLSYEFYIGPIPKGMFVCHKCDNRKCINPKHLFVGTVKDNNTDMSVKNRNRKGSKHHWARFCEKDILSIVQLYNLGKSPKELAALFGTSRGYIYDILHGERWNWLTNIKGGRR